MSRRYVSSLLISAVFIAGCVGMPLTSAYKLRQLDPMEVDPAQFKVAIRADERLGIPQDAAQISLKFEADDGSLHIDDTYMIEIVRNPAMAAELFAEKRPGESFTVLQLSESDARKLMHVQSQLRPYSERRRGGTLSFGVDLRGLCAHSPMPAGEVRVDIFVQASDDDGFFMLGKDVGLRRAGDGTDAVHNSFTECEQRPVTGNRNESSSTPVAYSGPP